MVDTLLQFLTCWGTTCEDVGFLAEFDFNGNCQIDAMDLLNLLADFASDAASAGKQAVTGRK
jgi:hypothetical protein